MAQFTVISRYSSWIFDDVEASSQEEALKKAGDLKHSDQEIGEVAEFLDHIVPSESIVI